MNNLFYKKYLTTGRFQEFKFQVSKQLSLNKVTVYDIFRKLLEEKYIIEIGQGFSTNSGGRKPIMVENEANLTAIFERDFSTSKM